MFRSLLKDMKISEDSAPIFYHYLNRHIELDEDEHWPMALGMLESLCSGDTKLEKEALETAHLSLESQLLIHVYDLKSRSKVSGISSVAKKNLFESQFNFFTSDLPAVKSLKTFFSHSTNIKVLSNLIKELDITDFKTSKSGIFFGKTIMFTGGLGRMSRAEAKALVEKEGGKILGTVSKKLDYLVVGDTKPTSKKIERAKQLNISILDENSWHALLNG